MTVVIESIQMELLEGYNHVGRSVSGERKYFSNFEGATLDQASQYVSKNIATHHLQFVALDDGAVVGFCELDPSPHPVHAHTASMDMALLPEARGKGIGKRLLTTAIGAARCQGLRRIGLSVFSDNLRAIRLYKSCGFEHEGILRNHCKIDGREFDMLMMGLLLKSPEIEVGERQA